MAASLFLCSHHAALPHDCMPPLAYEEANESDQPFSRVFWDQLLYLNLLANAALTVPSENELGQNGLPVAALDRSLVGFRAV